MDNVLMFEFCIDGKFLSIYCGILEDNHFAYAFFDGKSASRKFLRGECRLFKYQFQALENIFTPERLRFSLYGEVGISCDIKITNHSKFQSNRGLANILPRNVHIEFISQLSEFVGEVTINGKTYQVNDWGYIHRISTKRLPDRFYALNLLGDNVCLASYMASNAIWIYNFDSFLTAGTIGGQYYRFADYNLSTISVIDDGNHLLVKLQKGKTELNLCAECGNEQFIKYNNRIIRANNYTKADVVLNVGNKQVYKGSVSASLLINGKIKVGKDVETSKFCEASVLN
ncbi:MAG TPA: hypothetical protein VIL26_06025 [Clostridia bacterium]